MSRIDEALRRARGEDPGTNATESPDEAAWAFGDTALEPATPPVAEAPPTEPRLRQDAVQRPSAQPGPETRGDDGPLQESLAGNEKLVGGALQQLMVEEYRKLAASLHQAQIERGLKVLLIASAVPGEGKTLTAANLALTLSMSYARRTLLIDADLRKPSMHTLFRLPTTAGLSEGLSSDEQVRVSAVQLSRLLAVLPAGRPVSNPVPLLTSERMQQLLDDARQYFDWVIIDTPPVGLLTDANLLTKAADASLLVVNAGRTQHALVEKAVQALGRPKIFGVVMNRVENHTAISGSGYRGYYRDYLPAER